MSHLPCTRRLKERRETDNPEDTLWTVSKWYSQALSCSWRTIQTALSWDWSSSLKLALPLQLLHYTWSQVCWSCRSVTWSALSPIHPAAHRIFPWCVRPLPTLECIWCTRPNTPRWFFWQPVFWSPAYPLVFRQVRGWDIHSSCLESTLDCIPFMPAGDCCCSGSLQWHPGHFYLNYQQIYCFYSPPRKCATPSSRFPQPRPCPSWNAYTGYPDRHPS